MSTTFILHNDKEKDKMVDFKVSRTNGRTI